MCYFCLTLFIQQFIVPHAPKIAYTKVAFITNKSMYFLT